MGNPFRHNIDTEFSQLCLADSLQRDPRTGEAARALVLAQSGVTLEPASFDRLVDNLANLRHLHNAQPDDIHMALVINEPSLRSEA